MIQECPLTHRMICFDCWNGKHGPNAWVSCRNIDCNCSCKESVNHLLEERAARSKAKRERKALMTKLLESPDNPLRAVNEDYKSKRPRL